MQKHLSLAIAVTFSLFSFGSLFAETAEELRKKSDEKFESAVEGGLMGILEIGAGAFTASRGNPAAGTCTAGLGVKSTKDAGRELREVARLREQARLLEEQEKKK